MWGALRHEQGPASRLTCAWLTLYTHKVALIVHNTCALHDAWHSQAQARASKQGRAASQARQPHPRKRPASASSAPC
eukprot:scaffold144947_cov18-Tisochrysis_lutea.AAC.1